MNKKIEWSFFFWLVGIILGAILIYLLVTGSTLANAGQLQQAAFISNAATAFMAMFLISLAFIIMIEIGVVIKTNFKPIPKNNTTAAYGIWIGLIAWTLLLSITSGTQINSVVNLPQSAIFAQAGSALTEFWQSVILNIAAPFAEETTFLLGVPLVLFSVLLVLKRDLKLAGINKLLDNTYVQVGIVATISSLIFAFLHVGNSAISSFLIAAIVFRVVLIGLVWLDQLKNIIPLAELTFFFALGCHVANNILSTGGFIKFVSLMATGGGEGVYALLVGWFILVFFGLAAILVIQDLTKKRLAF